MRENKTGVSEKALIITLVSFFTAAALIAGVAAAVVRFAGKRSNSSFPESTPQSESASSSIARTETDEIVYESDEGTAFSVPDTLRAVYLRPGVDFYTRTGDNAQTVRRQIDAALDATVKLNFNSIVVFLKTDKGVFYKDAVLPAVFEDFDPLAYLLAAAAQRKLYTYTVYPAMCCLKDGKITTLSDFSKETVKQLETRAADFATQYAPNAVVLDNYTLSKNVQLEAFFKESGSAGSMEDFLRARVTENIRSIRNAMRRQNKTSQIGFLASGVWANEKTDPRGSKTTADFESYVNGFADTRSFVLNEKFNFVMVENLMPTDSVKNNFKTIAAWWTDLCSQVNLPYYNIHASSKLMSSLGEFSSPDQLILQVNVLEKLKTYCGSVFDSLSALNADPEGSTTLLLKYFSDKTADRMVFRKLSMTLPKTNQVTTYESSIAFSGATDPNFQTLFNGQPVSVTEKGYFAFDASLKVGKNTFSISHKGKTVHYTVTRKVKLLESVSPTGKIEVDGGTQIAFTVRAYTGSTVTARIAGSTVQLKEQAAEQASDTQLQSQYRDFEGVFQAPPASESLQNLGTVRVTASWEGYQESMNGAAIYVFPKPAEPVVAPGVTARAVKIKAQYAETFPTDRLNDQSQPYCYPLPAGAVDYIVGNELSFTSGGTTYRYYNLMSGQRVYAKDVEVIEAAWKTSEISSVALNFDGRFAHLLVENSWSVPFKAIENTIRYGPDGRGLASDYRVQSVTYRIFYTDKIDLSKVTCAPNPLVQRVECVLKTVSIDGREIPVCDIILHLKTAGGYFGATPSYQNENQTLDVALNVSAPVQKANNAYGYTLKGAVIVLDAGHDPVKDPGAVGVLKDNETGEYLFPEHILNAAVRDQMAAILKELGATVITVDNAKMIYAAQRLPYFQSKQPHMMINIHHNSSTDASATGPVCCYFNSYSQLLGKYLLHSVGNPYINGKTYPTKAPYFYPFQMNREPYYPSVTFECGFISNAVEHELLAMPENQKKIAQQMVRGLLEYFVQTGSLNHAGLAVSSSSQSR